jgi:hypothetical protein
MASTSNRKRARCFGSKLPIVPPRKARSRLPSLGSWPRCRWKSPTTACTSEPGVLDGDLLGGGAQRRLRHVEGHEAAKVAGGGEPVEQQAGLLEVPEPSSISVSAPVSLAISAVRAARIERSARVG